MGGRRTGKTTLVEHALGKRKSLYFFIGKKSDQLQCIQFQKQTEEMFGLRIHGQITNIAALLEGIMIYGKERKMTVMIDEFQRLDDINGSIISDIQRIWKKNIIIFEKSLEAIK